MLEYIIKDSEFSERMANEVLPFISEKIKDAYFQSFDGASLHYQYLLNENEMGTIVMSHGYCEFTTKYFEIMYYFYRLGYSVFIIDHRGHGYSDRMVKGFSKVHIDRFGTYVKDFKGFTDVIAKVHPSEHYYLYCHSMGGAVGALYLEEYPDFFEKAVLSSPMMEMSSGDANKLVVKAICILSYLPFCRTMYVPGHKDYDHSYKYPKCSSISEPRYRYQYDEREKDEHYRSNGASLCWTREALNVSKKIIKNANLVKIPVILLQASEDYLVLPSLQNRFAELSPGTRLIRFVGSKHEIFNATDEIIADYYKTIAEFLNSEEILDD